MQAIGISIIVGFAIFTIPIIFISRAIVALKEHILRLEENIKCLEEDITYNEDRINKIRENLMEYEDDNSFGMRFGSLINVNKMADRMEEVVKLLAKNAGYEIKKEESHYKLVEKEDN